MRRRACALLTLTLLAGFLTATAAPAETVDDRGSIAHDGGGERPAASAAGVQSQQQTPNEINPYDVVYNTNFAAFGLGGLRNNGTGVIEVTGIEGTVTNAILYWQGPTNSEDPDANAEIRWNGFRYVGDNIGYSHDNCWGYANSQAYRAEVVVEGNGTYEVSDLVKDGGDVNINGVSLLIFYDDGDPSNNSTVAVFDGNDSNVDNPYDRPGWNASLTNLPYAGGTATLGLHVSDGQTFPDAALWANDTLLAPAGAVFDGNTVPGWPGPTGNGSLWDIREFDVTDILAGGATSIGVTTGVLSDCLSLVVATVELEFSGLSLTPPHKTGYAGSSTQFQAQALDPDSGTPRAGEELVFEVVSGPHSDTDLSGAGCFVVYGQLRSCRVPSDGRIWWTYASTADARGPDTVRVVLDENGNGVYDPGEPVAYATVVWLEPIRLVSLGDSYSSGEGVGNYFPETDTDRNACHRSRDAYPSWIRPPHHGLRVRDYVAVGSSAVTWDFLACSGARSFNVYTFEGRDGLADAVGQYDESPQLAQPPANADGVNMVTMTIGGNDANFAKTLTLCAIFNCVRDSFQLRTQTDWQRFDTWVAGNIAAVGPKVDATYEDIKARAPDAAVFILGYPQIFPTGLRQLCPGLLPFNRAEQDFLRGAADVLDALLADRVAAAGFHYVPVADHFAGHEVCGADGEWIHGFRRGEGFTVRPSVESFHPNPEGARQYAEALNEYMRRRALQATRLLPSGLPANPDGSGLPPSISALQQAAVESSPRVEDLSVRPAASRPPESCTDLYTPGETVRVSGEGFAPGHVVDLLLGVQGMEDFHDALELGLATADSAGRIETEVVIPVDVLADTVAGAFALGVDPEGRDLMLIAQFHLLDERASCALTAPPAPVVDAPAEGAVYQLHEPVAAAFTCPEATSGPEVTSCFGTAEPGEPVYTSAVGTFTFTVVAMNEHGVTATTTVTYHVAEPSGAEDDAGYALFATEKAVLGRGAVVRNGDVGVNDASGTLVVGRSARAVDPETTVAADRVTLARDATVNRVATNSLHQAAGASATQVVSPLDLPLVDDLPPQPSPGPGGADLEVEAGHELTLEPGDYGALATGIGAGVTLLPGSYTLNAATLGHGTTIHADEADLVIAGDLLVDSAATVSARTITVLGDTVRLDREAQLAAALTAPAAAVHLDRGVRVVGPLAGRTVTTDRGVSLGLR